MMPAMVAVNMIAVGVDVTVQIVSVIVIVGVQRQVRRRNLCAAKHVVKGRVFGYCFGRAGAAHVMLQTNHFVGGGHNQVQIVRN